MKKLLFALALLILTSNSAFAIVCNSNTDKWNVGQWCVTTTDTLVPTSTGSQQVVYENYTTANTNNQLLENESGKVITDTGGSTDGTCTAPCGGSKHLLPRAKVGLTYTIIAGSKDTVTVDTIDTGDTIQYSISGTLLDAGDSIKSTGQAGDAVTLTSTAPGKWSIQSMKAVWTDNSTN